VPETLRFIPATSLEGGTPVGSSYLKTYATCPYMFFNQYIRPVGETEDARELTGIRPRWQSRALHLGTMNHAFLEHLYLSGCRDGEDTGEWDIDRAVDGLELAANEVRSEYQELTEWKEDLLQAKMLGFYYMDEYGPKSPNRDWPRFQVAFDGLGRPLIERQFELDLGYSGYYVTSKPYLIMWKDGRLMTRDHKTSAASYARRRASNIDTDPQFTMEHMILSELFPGELLHASEINILVKGLLPKGQRKDKREPMRFIRNTTRRSSDTIESFKLDTIDLLQQIDERVATFQRLWEATGDLESSAGAAFPRHGMRTDACHAYNRPCDFIDFCTNQDRISTHMRAFSPRRVAKRENRAEEIDGY